MGIQGGPTPPPRATPRLKFQGQWWLIVHNPINKALILFFGGDGIEGVPLDSHNNRNLLSDFQEV